MGYESYECELLAEVKQDMAEFGSDLKVIAIYSIFPEDPDKYYITVMYWLSPNVISYIILIWIFWKD